MRNAVLETLYWACVQTDAGKILLYGTSLGITGIEFIDDRSELELSSYMRERFTQSVVNSNQTPFFDPIKKAIDYILGTSHQRPEMVLTGTTFQIEVWEELLRLENGEIISYSELARRIGRPRSVRAVANAVANNRIAILIPCHRVIGKNGSLGGYRWGVEKKKSLLSKEGFPEL